MESVVYRVERDRTSDNMLEAAGLRATQRAQQDRDRLHNEAMAALLRPAPTYGYDAAAATALQQLEGWSGTGASLSLDLGRADSTLPPSSGVGFQNLLMRYFREEVPFERLVVDSGRLKDLALRPYALFHLLESLLRVGLELTLWGTKKGVEKVSGHEFEAASSIHWDVLKAELHSVKYSGWAIISPTSAIASARTNGHIGGTTDAGWGTAYYGQRTFWVIGNYDNKHGPRQT